MLTLPHFLGELLQAKSSPLMEISVDRRNCLEVLPLHGNREGGGGVLVIVTTQNFLRQCTFGEGEYGLNRKTGRALFLFFLCSLPSP